MRRPAAGPRADGDGVVAIAGCSDHLVAPEIKIPTASGFFRRKKSPEGEGTEGGIPGSRAGGLGVCFGGARMGCRERLLEGAGRRAFHVSDMSPNTDWTGDWEWRALAEGGVGREGVDLQRHGRRGTAGRRGGAPRTGRRRRTGGVAHERAAGVCVGGAWQRGGRHGPRVLGVQRRAGDAARDGARGDAVLFSQPSATAGRGSRGGLILPRRTWDTAVQPRRSWRRMSSGVGVARGGGGLGLCARPPSRLRTTGMMLRGRGWRAAADEGGEARARRTPRRAWRIARAGAGGCPSVLGGRREEGGGGRVQKREERERSTDCSL